MKKVCFLNGHLILREHKTGVHYFHEVVTKKIAELNKNYKLSVAYFENDESKKLRNKSENKWISELCITKPNWLRIFSYVLPIELFFGRHDVYFCDGLFPITIYKSKRICLVHDLMVKIYPENYSFIKKLYLNMFFRNLPKADLVVCVSETTKLDVIKYYNVNPNRIIVCYNGVDDLKRYSVDFDEVNGAPLNNNFAFYLGDMRPNKNIPNTVKGFLDCCEKHNISDFYFYIAGKKSGDYEQAQELVNNSSFGNQVRFLGYVDDKQKYALFDKTKAVVLLSKYEGFGMPIIEGMQHYKPIITSNVSSMKEIGEGTAILVDPEDVDSISNTFWDFYSDKYTVDKEEYQKKLEKYTFNNVALIINDGIISIMSE